ncbi:MAG: hypothetical protein JRI23_15695 [Deltaproteobacteria bacterium]|nr:hypothetical protein [Deltaproteobacteria bacterium]MBW2533204.1 hypothetical protein [Deltaproteobacteria bacterium]
MATAALGLAVGCGSPATPIAEAPRYEPAGQAKCGVVADHDEPLIIEWPAAERANLEALSKRGTVVVRYQGCEMQVLTGCHVARPYGYTPTTQQQEQVTIRNEDELYARLPLGAARLAGELEKSGQLTVAMTIVGTYASDRKPVPEDRLEGACAGATHVVDAMTVGAFEFTTGAAARVGAGADLPVVGAGARSETHRSTLNRGGDRAACVQATGEDGQPPYGCGALLRVEVARIAPAEAPSPEPTEPIRSVQPDSEPKASVEPDLAAADPPPTEPVLPPALPPESGSTTTPPRDEPAPEVPPDLADASAFPWYGYVLGGLLVAGITVGVIAGAIKEGNDEDEEEYVPQPGGLGEGTLVFQLPVVRW